MAHAHDTKFSFLASHGGPGSRKEHNYVGQHQTAPLRTASLPSMGIPAGFSAPLGNKLSLEAYANLRGPFHARRDVAVHPPNPRARDRQIHQVKSEDLWLMPERIRPETLPPAGQMMERPRGKRMVGENTNVLSHVDSLIWNCDIDRSNVVGRPQESQIYHGAAGLNAKAERTPVYGHLPPVTLRTFGEEGPTRIDSFMD
eukprot:TRINITY_DN84462_c0_g1_i1.p1 TRINITY_DN84462_c0_g1~~TRINITY_DN84462_c0_g1_i1.p1  ORF type:complete len:224 (+),score=18.38 TRINITY_DN84462_c0_g1_i1:73-672(+)